MKETGRRGIVLKRSSVPHRSEIHHGIPDMINSYGLCVLTEDSFPSGTALERPPVSMTSGCTTLRPGMQLQTIKTRDDLDSIQLNLFGCVPTPLPPMRFMRF